MKPDEIQTYTEETTKEEVWVLNNGVLIHNSVGCDHYWEQFEEATMVCKKCGLGSYGIAKDGKVLSHNVIIKTYYKSLKVNK